MSDKIDRVATAGTLGAHASQGATMTSLNTNESTNKGENEGKQSTLSYSKNMKSFDKCREPVNDCMENVCFLDHGENYGGHSNISGGHFPPTEERAGPEGAEEEPPRVISSSSTSTAPLLTHKSAPRDDRDDEEDIDDEDDGEEQCKRKSIP